MRRHHVSSKSFRRRFNVMCLLGDGWYDSRPACGSYTETKRYYVFWSGSFLVVRCPLYRRYSINGPRIHFAAFLSLTEKNHIWTTRKGFLPSVRTIWITVGQGPIALAVGAGGGCLDIFTLICPFSPLSPSLWETVRYRLKYCLKGPLNPKQPTNHQLASCILQHQAAD